MGGGRIGRDMVGGAETFGFYRHDRLGCIKNTRSHETIRRPASSPPGQPYTGGLAACTDDKCPNASATQGVHNNSQLSFNSLPVGVPGT